MLCPSRGFLSGNPRSWACPKAEVSIRRDSEASVHLPMLLWALPFFPGQLGPRQQEDACHCSVTSCARIAIFGASKDQSQRCSQERREVALPPLLSTFLSSPIGPGQSPGWFYGNHHGKYNVVLLGFHSCSSGRFPKWQFLRPEKILIDPRSGHPNIVTNTY